MLNVPFLRGLFLFSRLHAADLLLCLAAGVISVGWFEIVKRYGGISAEYRTSKG